MSKLALILQRLALCLGASHSPARLRNGWTLGLPQTAQPNSEALYSELSVLELPRGLSREGLRHTDLEGAWRQTGPGTPILEQPELLGDSRRRDSPACLTRSPFSRPWLAMVKELCLAFQLHTS